MYFAIHLFLALKFCSTHRGVGAPQAARQFASALCLGPLGNGRGQAIVKLSASTKCYLAQGVCKCSQAEKAPGGLLDLGTQAWRGSSLDRGLRFIAHFYTNALRTPAKAGSKVLLNVLTAA